MPRKYARRSVGTWKDEDFRSLDLAHQGLFDALCAYPGISWCGVIDYLPRRLIECSKGLTESRLRKMVDHLAERDFVCVDSDFNELLVRTFIRYDGVLRMYNMGKSCAMAYGKVHSTYLKSIIVTELTKLKIDEPDIKGWKGIAEMNQQLYDEVCLNGSVRPLFNTSANSSLNT